METGIIDSINSLRTNLDKYKKQIAKFDKTEADADETQYQKQGWPCDPQHIEMIISDVDGTIVDATEGKDYVSPELIGAFHTFESLGGIIALATGRSWTMLKPMVRNLELMGAKTITGLIDEAERNNQPFEKWEQKLLQMFSSTAVAAVDGGSRIVDMDGKIIWGVAIEKRSVRKIIDILNTLSLTSVFWSDKDKDFSRTDLETGWNLSDLDPTTDIYFIGLRCIGLTLDQVERLAHHIKNSVEDVNVGISSAQYNPGFYDLHITDTQATKRNAAKEIMRIHKTNRANVVAAGDGHNDIELFRACGVRYAVGNAEQALKDHADVIGPAIAMDSQIGIARQHNYGFVSLLNTIIKDKCQHSALI